MVKTLGGVQFFRPDTRRSLPGTILALKGPPIPLALLEGICGYFYSRGLLDLSMAYSPGFLVFCGLRSSFPYVLEIWRFPATPD